MEIINREKFQNIFCYTKRQSRKNRYNNVKRKKVRKGWEEGIIGCKDAVAAYYEMEESEAFQNPLTYIEVQENDFEALFLPGGHDKGVKEYLESKILQRIVVDFFKKQKPIAAICHGVVLAARSVHPETGKSVLYNYKTTSLLKSQELLAYNMTRLWLKDYYLTYPGLCVEDEVKSILSDPQNFLQGPKPLFRDHPENMKRGFVVEDKNYLSARWPGDVYSLSTAYNKLLETTL